MLGYQSYLVAQLYCFLSYRVVSCAETPAILFMPVIMIRVKGIPEYRCPPELHAIDALANFYFAVNAKLTPRMPIPKNANAMHVLLL
jgi:hypothetical protein